MTKIIIEYSKFLDPIFIGYIKSQEQWKDWNPPAFEEVLRNIELYKEEWSKKGGEILDALCKITTLTFRRDVIDVYIVSGNPRQFSNPIVIKGSFLPDEFVDVLTHELIHRLFVLNSLPKKIIINEKCSTETDSVKNHILLHALLKYIYLDILSEPNRLTSNIERSKKHSTKDYVRAWEIVEKEGYKNLINEFVCKLKSPLYIH
jgi:hypothetical protein